MLGLALERELVKEGVSVTLLVRTNSERRLDVSGDTTVLEWDLMNPFSLESQGTYDAFFHLAWIGTRGKEREDKARQRTNVVHTLDCVNLAHKLDCKVFVGAGSQAEYGPVHGVITEDTPTNPQSAYGRAKLAAGEQSHRLCESYGIRHVWARLFSLYGQGDNPGNMMMSWVISLLEGRRMSFTSGEQLWDYLHCDDGARGMYLLAQQGSGVYNLAYGKSCPLGEYITMARDALNPQIPLGLGELDLGTLQSLQADTRKIFSDTGFCPQISFKQGVALTANALKESKNAQENKRHNTHL